MPAHKQWLFSLVLRLEQWACAIDGHPRVLLAFIAIYETLLLVPRALSMRLWHDELFTLYISQLPSLASLYTAYVDGIDVMPIQYHLLMRVFASGFALRMVSFAGVLIFSLSMWYVVRRYVSPVYAACVFLLPASTMVSRFMIEARSYGLVLGFAGLSLVCWMLATERVRRPWTVFAMTLSLALCIGFHPYGGLILVPLGLGELARTLRQKRMDWPVWVGLVVSPAAVLQLIPAWAGISSYTAHDWSRSQSWAMLEMRGMALPLVGVIALGVLSYAFVIYAGLEEKLWPSSGRGFAAHVWICLACFLLIPVVKYAVTAAVGLPNVPRYGITTMLGAYVLTGLFLWRAMLTSRAAGLILMLLLMAGGAARAYLMESTFAPQAPGLEELGAASEEYKLPIVVANGMDFLQLQHYSAPAVRANLWYIADPDRAIAYTGTDSVDLGLIKLSHHHRVQILNWEQFCMRNRRFLLFGNVNPDIDWIFSRLRDFGANLRLVATGPIPIFEVELPVKPE